VAKVAPLGVKEIGLMLRTGYSSAQVQQEVAARHFIGTIDPAAETSLLKSGATPALLAALKNGTFAVPAGQLAAAQRELAEQANRKALQAEEARKFNTLYQSQLQQARAASPTAAATTHVLAPQFRGDLVRSTDGKVAPVADESLASKKLIGLYFSAQWCGPCRKFTPELVQFYKRVSAAHPEFEIVFVSNDRSADAMAKYMRDMQMPWPAIAFEKLGAKAELQKYGGDGIPCLVVIDAAGKVVSHSYEGAKYLGPGKVVADLEKLFGSATPVALQR
jgi:nucleoredoxin